MPVAPSCQSGCQAQVPCAGSAGASNQPLGVSRSTRPSPLTSPEPTPWPAACDAQVVLLELEALAVALLDDLVPDDHVDRVGQDVRHAVARQVDHPGRLDVPGHVDLVIGPGRAGFPGVLDPADVLGEVGARDEIGVAVAVDVERQGREIVVVGALPLDVADVIRLPVGSLIPGVARDDVELAVVVDVEDARRLELALAVDRVLLPLRARPALTAGARRKTTRAIRERSNRDRVIDASPEIQTLGSVQGLRYSLVRY